MQFWVIGYFKSNDASRNTITALQCTVHPRLHSWQMTSLKQVTFKLQGLACSHGSFTAWANKELNTLQEELAPAVNTSVGHKIRKRLYHRWAFEGLSAKLKGPIWHCLAGLLASLYTLKHLKVIEVLSVYIPFKGL